MWSFVQVAMVKWVMEGHEFEYRVLVVPRFGDLFLLRVDFFDDHPHTKPEFEGQYWLLRPVTAYGVWTTRPTPCASSPRPR